MLNGSLIALAMMESSRPGKRLSRSARRSEISRLVPRISVRVTPASLQLGEVVAEIGLGAEVEELAAIHRDALVAGEIADDRQPRLVAEHGKHVGKVDLVGRWVRQRHCSKLPEVPALAMPPAALLTRGWQERSAASY